MFLCCLCILYDADNSFHYVGVRTVCYCVCNDSSQNSMLIMNGTVKKLQTEQMGIHLFLSTDVNYRVNQFILQFW